MCLLQVATLVALLSTQLDGAAPDKIAAILQEYLAALKSGHAKALNAISNGAALTQELVGELESCLHNCSV